ncbi:filamentous hemagglutinin N-terminal domain-containing protein, partial [Dechloromonas sp. ZS-1]|uniref:beta strand repeat-containing protein n=1 Tax=Dechloromonas sp. ZS-1 TaxID=3138067 RepID=UPI0031FC83C4
MNACSTFAVRTLVAAISACFTGSAHSAPQAPTVVAGQAAFQQTGNTLTVTNAPGTIINWQSFSINRDEVVRFLQQSSTSQVLNRVTGIDPSVILGQLQSNGRVLLINPNGVLFGKGAQVDVAGLLVSTLQLKDADFLSGRYKFNDTPGAGSISNQGTIRTQSGGHVVLIAPKVENSGIIQSPEGQILLAAGRSVTLADPDKPAIQVEITNRDNTAVNLGTLIAKNVTLYGGIIKNSGLIQATTAVVGENGKIRLQAKYDVENTGTLQANGPQGGDILLQAQEDVARVQGLVEAKGSLPTVNPENAPKSEQLGKGGRIEVLAPDIVVDGVVDASGTTGGGAILIGGQYQGGNAPVPTDWSVNPALQRASLSLDNPYAASPNLTESTVPLSGSPVDPSQQTGNPSQNSPLMPNRPLPTARTTTIGANARIRADGIEEGDGGVVVVWADESTHVAGLVSARGGRLAGNGGLIETSGKIDLAVDIPVDASAAAGRAGLWLLDPNNIQITNIDANITGNPDFTTTNNTATINAATIQTALNAGTNVTISTGTAGTNSQAGDILVSAAINVSPATTTKLTLQAHNNITFAAGVSASGAGALNLDLIPDSDASGAGKVLIGSTLNLNGGALSVLGSGTVDFTGSTINAGTLTATTANFTAGANTLNSLSTFTNVNASGGSQTGSGALTAANVTMTSGSLGGSGGITISNSLNWQSGTFYGPTVLASGATATLTTTASKVVGANFTNDGTLNIDGGRININSGFNLQNSVGATINLNTSDGYPIYFGTGNATFNNLGTLNQLAVGSHEINLSLGTYNNSGTVNVLAGALSLRNSGTDSGNYVLSAGATLASGSGATRIFSGSITGGGTFSVTGGTATIGTGAQISSGLALSSGTVIIASGAAQTVSSLSLTGGTLNSSDSLTVTGSATLSSGTFTGVGGLTTSGATTLGSVTLSGSGGIGTSGTTTVSGAFVMSGSSWINSGTVNVITPGSVNLGTGGVWTNTASGTINFNSTTSTLVTYSGSGSNNRFNNAGTINQLHNAVHGFAMTSSDGTAQFNNTGSVNVVAGSLTITGGGTDTGNYNIAAGSTLGFNFGTRSEAGVVSGAGIFANSGSAVTTTFVSGSTLNIAQLNVSFGTLNLNSNASLPDTVAVTGGTLNLATGSAKTLTNLIFTGGALVASDPLTVTGTATLGGTLSGTGGLTTSGSTTVSGPFALGGGSWVNSGTVDVTGTGYVNLGSGGVWTNTAAGTVNFNSSTGAVVTYSGSGSNSRFNNAGTINQLHNAAHTLNVTYSDATAQFNNTGSVNVAAGSLTISGGGTDTGNYNIAAGSTLGFSYGARSESGTVSGAGIFANSGATITFAPGSTFSPAQLNQTGGTLLLNTGAPHTLSSLSLSGGTINTSDALTVTGATTLGYGWLSGTGSLTTLGTTIAGSYWFYLQTTWNNAGYATVPSAGIMMTNGTINNLLGATFDVSSAYSSPFTSSGGVNTFNNAGTFNKLGASSVTASPTAFNNSGTVNVQGGTLTLFGGTDTGAYSISTGATLESVSGTRLMTASSSVGGSGTLKLSSGSLQFLGTYNLPSAPLVAGGLLDFEPINSVALGAFTASAGTYTWGGNTSFGTYLNSGATTTFSGASNVSGLTVSSGSVLSNSNFSAGSVTVTGGTLTVDGTASIANYAQSGGGVLNGSGTLTATNTFYWTGGVMSGTGTTVVAAGATGALNTPTTSTSLYRTLDIRGTVD